MINGREIPAGEKRSPHISALLQTLQAWGRVTLPVSIIRTLVSYRHPQPLRKRFPSDNGSEKADHVLINKTLDTQPYFCEPYHSWEKKSIEQKRGQVGSGLLYGNPLKKKKGPGCESCIIHPWPAPILIVKNGDRDLFVPSWEEVCRSSVSLFVQPPCAVFGLCSPTVTPDMECVRIRTFIRCRRHDHSELPRSVNIGAGCSPVTTLA